MSTQRFDIRHAPAPRESFRLLYISKSKFGGDWNSTTHTQDRKSTRLNSSHSGQSRMPSSA